MRYIRNVALAHAMVKACAGRTDKTAIHYERKAKHAIKTTQPQTK